MFISRKVFIAYLNRGNLCFDGMYKFNLNINILLYLLSLYIYCRLPFIHDYYSNLYCIKWQNVIQIMFNLSGNRTEHSISHTVSYSILPYHNTILHYGIFMFLLSPCSTSYSLIQQSIAVSNALQFNHYH